MKCPYCGEKLIEYKNPTTFEKLYYCGSAECPKTYRVLASKPTWKLLTELLKEKKDEQILA
jgi:hypothetical protein